MGLSGVAAFCISKCALSAGALGRNCHLLPHCQPRRGYASFADSQPPALITRSTPSLEPPGQSRHIPSRCCTAGRRAGAGASMQTAPPHPSLSAGIAPRLRLQLKAAAPVVWSSIPLLALRGWFGVQPGSAAGASMQTPLPAPIPARGHRCEAPTASLLVACSSFPCSPPHNPPTMVLGCSRRLVGAVRANTRRSRPIMQAPGPGGSGLAAPPGIPPGIAPLRDARSHAPSELPRSIPGARPPRGRAEPGPPSVAAPAGTSRALNP